jgi:hypothetical protein
VDRPVEGHAGCRAQYYGQSRVLDRPVHPAVWGARQLNSLTGEEITVWKNGLPVAAGVSHRTAKDARSLLHTILGDAALARPPLIHINPAVRPRNRGRRTGRRLERSPQRAWATPLEVLLAAERAALLSGRDDELTMLVTIGYTGMRWGETVGLEREYVLPTLVNVEWQLREIRGRFYRLPPKDDSYRSTNWEPLVPVDTPDFLAGLLAGQAAKYAQQRCNCAREHGGTGRYMFYSPEGGHYRRSNFARRVFRPAWDGRYEPVNGRPGCLVVVDATACPGQPVASWAPALPGKPFAPPSGRGVPHLVSADGTGHCSSCGRAVRLRLDGTTVTHKTKDEQCPGSGQQAGDDAPLACWLPVRDGLTPHGLRHSHKTWMEFRRRHPRDLGRAAARSRHSRDARPVRPCLAPDAGGTDGSSPGPLGGIAAGTSQHGPALPRACA